MTDQPTDTTATEQSDNLPELAKARQHIDLLRDELREARERADTADPEWAKLKEQAKIIATAGMVPDALRGKPADALLVLMTGNEIGLGPATALQRIAVIKGKATLDAQGMLTLARRAGHSVTGEATPEGATVTGKRGDTGDEMTVTFTLEDAQRAGLGGQGWSSYPEDMCWARAVTRLCRRLFPDCLGGVSYAPEDLSDEPSGQPASVEARLVGDEGGGEGDWSVSPHSPPSIAAVGSGSRRNWRTHVAIRANEVAEVIGVDADHLRHAAVAYATDGEHEGLSGAPESVAKPVLAVLDQVQAGTLRTTLLDDDNGSLAIVGPS